MARRGSNNSREMFCDIEDAERCEITIELHKATSIQGFATYEPGRCAKRSKGTLKNKAGESTRLCGTHRRMALEGKIDPQGVTMNKQDRSNCYMFRLPYPHAGEWSE